MRALREREDDGVLTQHGLLALSTYADGISESCRGAVGNVLACVQAYRGSRLGACPVRGIYS